MAVNEDGVLATGGDNGSMWYWDWKSGHNFQQDESIVQPGEAASLSLWCASSAVTA
jgi:pleiotropic regulator 1